MVGWVCPLEKAKLKKKSIQELTECYVETYSAVKSTARVVAGSKKLWREGNKSNLIKIGVACIVFPDPSPVGEIIGAGFLVAGAVQKGIQKRTLYLEDIRKDLKATLKELGNAQASIRS
jgi:hypothetical protein